MTVWKERQTFEWKTTDVEEPGSIWRFDIAEQGAGSRLRFSMVIGEKNNRSSAMATADPNQEQNVINARRQVHKANMQRTIEGIKSKVDMP